MTTRKAILARRKAIYNATPKPAPPPKPKPAPAKPAPAKPRPPKLYPIGPLAEWEARIRRSLEDEDVPWEEWCKARGVSARRVHRFLYEHGAKDGVTYVELDEILSPAGYRVEDLYGWEDR